MSWFVLGRHIENDNYTVYDAINKKAAIVDKNRLLAAINKKEYFKTVRVRKDGKSLCLVRPYKFIEIQVENGEVITDTKYTAVYYKNILGLYYYGCLDINGNINWFTSRSFESINQTFGINGYNYIEKDGCYIEYQDEIGSDIIDEIFGDESETKMPVYTANISVIDSEESKLSNILAECNCETGTGDFIAAIKIEEVITDELAELITNQIDSGRDSNYDSADYNEIKDETVETETSSEESDTITDILNMKVEIDIEVPDNTESLSDEILNIIAEAITGKATVEITRKSVLLSMLRLLSIGDTITLKIEDLYSLNLSSVGILASSIDSSKIIRLATLSATKYSPNIMWIIMRQEILSNVAQIQVLSKFGDEVKSAINMEKHRRKYKENKGSKKYLEV